MKTKQLKRARNLLEERLFDARTRIADLSWWDADLLAYGVKRYRYPEKRTELLKRIRGLRLALRELRA